MSIGEHVQGIPVLTVQRTHRKFNEIIFITKRGFLSRYTKMKNFVILIVIAFNMKLHSVSSNPIDRIGK